MSDKAPCTNCDESLGHCCEECEHPSPVMPRCDVALAPGVYTNATVHVNEQGCIVRVENGKPFVYAPDACCSPVHDISGGGEGLEGPPGPSGTNATITIGSVQTTEPGTPARIENVGTSTNAVLNFYLPRGDQGQNVEASKGTNFDKGGLIVENGLVTGVPFTYPPISTAQGFGENGIGITVEKNEDIGSLLITVNGSELRNQASSDADQKVQGAKNELNGKIDSTANALRDMINTLASRVSALESRG